MSDIRFYIPKDESIPTDLRLYVGENYVKYERTANGFLFKTLIDDEDDAMKVVQKKSMCLSAKKPKNILTVGGVSLLLSGWKTQEVGKLNGGI